MKHLVVDTNIIFSALLGGKVSQVFARAVIHLKLHTVKQLVEEIQRHRDKILLYTKLSRETVETLLNHILVEDLALHDITKIPPQTREKAKQLAGEADPDDWPFVALSMYLDVPLWTGDKELIRLAVRTEFEEFVVLDTHAVEMLLEGESWEEILGYLQGRYGETNNKTRTQ